MNINNWKVKDITFHGDERKQVAGLIKRLISNGWDLHEGEVIDGVAFGEEQFMDGEDWQIPTGFEVVQLINSKG